ncbi:MAG: sigma-70 family RNA polymerase sigma factor [Lachnospiraceae bacterium]
MVQTAEDDRGEWPVGLFKKKKNKMEEENLFYHSYRSTVQYVAGNILRGVGSDEDVEECVNDALCQAMLTMDKFDPKRGTLKTYVGIIARSTALEKRRQILRQRTVPFAEAFEITYEPEFELEYKELVQSIIRELKPREQELFTLYFLMQMPIPDIAKKLQLTRGAVDTRISRLRKKITLQLLADPFYQKKYGNEQEHREENIIFIEERRREGGVG